MESRTLDQSDFNRIKSMSPKSSVFPKDIMGNPNFGHGFVMPPSMKIKKESYTQVNSPTNGIPSPNKD